MKAYLVAHVKLKCGNQTGRECKDCGMIDRVMISSQQASSMACNTGNEIYLDIYQLEDETYEEAARKLEWLTINNSSFHWCLPLWEDRK